MSEKEEEEEVGEDAYIDKILPLDPLNVIHRHIDH